MDFKVEFRNKVVNGDEVTFDVGLNFEGMGAPFETWDGTIQAYYDYFRYYGFSWNKTIIKDLDLTIQNNGYSTHNYYQDTLRTAVVRNGAKVNTRFFSSSVFRLEWDNYSEAFAPPSLQTFYLNKLGYPTDDPTWEHLYTLYYSHNETYNGGNPVYLEDGTQATGWFNPRATFFGQSHGSTATYKVFMKIKIVVQSGQSVPSNLRDMFYLGTPNDSIASTEFNNYASPANTGIVGTFYMSEEGGAPAAATPEMKFGYSPLYQLEADANAHAGGDGTSHSHVLDGVTYYMPNGLTMGVDQFHGTYGLVLEHDMDDKSADAGSIDFSVLNVAESFVTDAGRSALELAPDGLIKLDSDLSLGTNGWTISMWFKNMRDYSSNTSGVAPIFMHWDGNMTSGSWNYLTTIAPSGQLSTFRSGPGYQSNGVVLDYNNYQGWHMITSVFDASSSEVTFYIDGAQVGSAVSWDGLNTLNLINSVENGGGYTYSRSFAEMISDLRVHTRSMDADEVAYWYAETTVVYITDNLTAHYPLTDDADTIVGTANGTLMGDASFNGSALVLDGSGDYVRISHDTSNNFGGVNDPFSVSMWFKSSADGPLLYKGRQSSSSDFWGIYLNANGTVSINGWDQGPDQSYSYATEGNTYLDNEWHHLLVTHNDGGMIYIYIDGDMQFSGGGWITNHGNSDYLTVGAYFNYVWGSAYFTGEIRDVRLWDRALGASEAPTLYAETTVSEEQGSGSSYDWTHSGQLTNIVKFVAGQDLNGNASYAYAKKEDDGSTTLYFTPDLTDFAAFGSYDSAATSIDGSPIFMEYGAGGKVAIGTDTGKVYQIELDGYSVPQNYTLLHDVVGGHPVNSLKYGYAMNVWIFEAGGEIYTIPAAGGGAVLRHTLPAGAKVVDFAEGDDGKVAFIVRLADFSLEPRVTPADWSVIYGPSSMVADAAVAIDFNYSHALDLWVSSDGGSAFTSVTDLLDLLS